jgi:hypothetical protein
MPLPCTHLKEKQMALKDDVTQTTAIIDFQLQPSTPATWTAFVRPSSATVGLDVVSFQPNGGQEEGAELCIFNDSTNDIILKHNDSRGTAGWRIQCSTGADITLPPGTPTWAILLENSTTLTNGWRLETL